jgi:hypothetical protein
LAGVLFLGTVELNKKVWARAVFFVATVVCGFGGLPCNLLLIRNKREAQEALSGFSSVQLTFYSSAFSSSEFSDLSLGCFTAEQETYDLQPVRFRELFVEQETYVQLFLRTEFPSLLQKTQL